MLFYIFLRGYLSDWTVIFKKLQLTRFIVAIILQYLQISNNVVHLKLIESYMSVLHQFLKSCCIFYIHIKKAWLWSEELFGVNIGFQAFVMKLLSFEWKGGVGEVLQESGDEIVGRANAHSCKDLELGLGFLAGISWIFFLVTFLPFCIFLSLCIMFLQYLVQHISWHLLVHHFLVWRPS